jgi:hypothetical protein
VVIAKPHPNAKAILKAKPLFKNVPQPPLNTFMQLSCVLSDYSEDPAYNMAIAIPSNVVSFAKVLRKYLQKDSTNPVIHLVRSSLSIQTLSKKKMMEKPGTLRAFGFGVQKISKACLIVDNVFRDLRWKAGFGLPSRLQEEIDKALPHCVLSRQRLAYRSTSI